MKILTFLLSVFLVLFYNYGSSFSNIRDNINNDKILLLQKKFTTPGTEDVFSDSIYIKEQKKFYGKIVQMMKKSGYNKLERDGDFDQCPINELHDDLLGFKFKSIHTEQVGFLDCDGPTYLNIYNNGLYIFNEGSFEHQCSILPSSLLFWYIC